MTRLCYVLTTGRIHSVTLDGKTELRLGRDRGAEVSIDTPYWPAEVARLVRDGDDWLVEAVVGGKVEGPGGVRLAAGQRLRLPERARFRAFPVTAWLEGAEDADGPTDEDGLALEFGAVIADAHRLLPERLNDNELAARLGGDELRGVETKINGALEAAGWDDPGRAALRAWAAGDCLLTTVLAKLLGAASDSRPWREPALIQPLQEQALARRADEVRERLGLDALPDVAARVAGLRAGFPALWREARPSPAETDYLARRHARKEIKDILFGYGPIEDFLSLDLVTEVMVVRPELIYVEVDGELIESGRRFCSEDVTLAIIRRIVGRVGRHIDSGSHPLVDARLDNGDRVNAIIPPLAVDGPTVTLRRHPVRRLRMPDLVARGTLPQGVANFLAAAVKARYSILVAGGTGSGKTTLLNCLVDFIPPGERVITAEDTAELQIGHKHLVRLEARTANLEGAGAFVIGDLVRNALRMRPHRILVGECRGAEALDMLQAMNTGHEGSLTTAHANSPDDALSRLETMVLSAGLNLPLPAIRRQLASALNLIVQVERPPGGRRRLSSVAAVVGLDASTGAVRTKDIYALEGRGAGARLRPTGCLPDFIERLEDEGGLPLESFFTD